MASSFTSPPYKFNKFLSLHFVKNRLQAFYFNKSFYPKVFISFCEKLFRNLIVEMEILE